MIDRSVVLLFAGSALFGSVIFVELWSDDTGASAKRPVAMRPEPDAPSRVPGPRVDELLATVLSRPLFSPTRQPAARANSDQPSGPGLKDVRLTGIVIEPGRRLAIFAMPGAKPMVRREGETLNDWRIDSITLGEVVLSGPAGSATLQPTIDASLGRQVALPPRPAQRPPQGAAPGPQPTGVAPRPGSATAAGPPKSRSVPSAQAPGTPMSPLRPPGAPRERQ
jgi:hypothetical protein